VQLEGCGAEEMLLRRGLSVYGVEGEEGGVPAFELGEVLGTLGDDGGVAVYHSVHLDAASVVYVVEGCGDEVEQALHY
jgi:hypothetical protein